MSHDSSETTVDYDDPTDDLVDDPDIEHSRLTRFGAELLGTFVLVLAIVATLVHGAITATWQNGATTLGLAPALAGGLILVGAVAAFGTVSGGHFNPAVTLGSAIAGRTRWIDVLPYWIAQFAGGSLAALVVRATMPQVTTAGTTAGATQALLTDPGLAGAANGFGTHTPLTTITTYADQNSGNRISLLEVPVLSALVLEIVAAIILVAVYLAVTHRRATRPLAPVAIGLTVGALILVTAPLTNAGVNPARSLAGAIVAGGWSWGQLWLFIVAPLAGAIIAGLVYRAFVLTSPEPTWDVEDDDLDSAPDDESEDDDFDVSDESDDNFTDDSGPAPASEIAEESSSATKAEPAEENDESENTESGRGKDL